MKIHMVKRSVVWLTIVCLCISSAVFAAQGPGSRTPAKQKRDRTAKAKISRSKIPPTFTDVAYGPDANNKLDFWKANTDKPAPLVVFIHGGGFRTGDKSACNQVLLKACLDSGIAYASINYRLSGVAIYPAAMYDSARAIQFIRSKAAEWNIDPQRIACTGGSAGAGISQWLAFHDDMADPKSDDLVARQSTRLTCALPIAMQCTYDPREIKKIVPGNAYSHVALKQFQGLPETFDWDKDPISAELDARLRDCSPITHLTKDDPPILAISSEANENIHHPNFGRYLKKQMDAIGVECEFYLESDFDGPQARVDAMLVFLKKHFGMQTKTP